ncbi:hypothetical protein G6F53_014314 [Rhizopus delemar]|nr:hypothetical protein G6F53_014314 [Rhizopus delemar]
MGQPPAVHVQQGRRADQCPGRDAELCGAGWHHHAGRSDQHRHELHPHHAVRQRLQAGGQAQRLHVR